MYTFHFLYPSPVPRLISTMPRTTYDDHPFTLQRRYPCAKTPAPNRNPSVSLFVPGSFDHGRDELVGEDEDLDAVEDEEEDEQDGQVLDPTVLQLLPEARGVA